MGITAALKAAQVVDNISQVLAIELICAAQALELRRPLRSSRPIEAVHRALRKVVPAMHGDRILADDLAAAKRAIDDGSIEGAVGKRLDSTS